LKKGNYKKIKYFEAPDIRNIALDIIDKLNLRHINTRRIYFIRSRGSKAKRVVARIHSLSRIWDSAIGIKPSYLIEVLCERYDSLHKEEQIETIIHEILHIPHSFGGGFRTHTKYVNKKNVKKYYSMYINSKEILNKAK
jgi:predicted metallopeptidase